MIRAIRYMKWASSLFFPESKEDKEREIDPKLLFPLKEWFMGFLPGHSFKWDFVEEEERRIEKAKDEEMRPIHEKVKEFWWN